MSCLEGTVTLLHEPITASISRIGSSIEMSATKALGLEIDVRLLRSLIDCGLTMERASTEGALTMLTKPMSASCSLVCSMLYMIVKRGLIHLDYMGNPIEWSVKANTEWSVAPIEQWQKGKIYIESDADSATFSSDINEGIDRKVTVVFSCEDADVERTLEQEGLRQQFKLRGGGVWRVRGGRFGVLKEAKPYTRVRCLESSGTQWIDTGFTFDPTKDTTISAVAESMSTGRTIIMGNYYNNNYRCFAMEFGGSSNSHVGAVRAYAMLKTNAALDLWTQNMPINEKRSISMSYTANTRQVVLKADQEEVNGVITNGTLSSRDTLRMFMDARASTSPIAYPLRIYSATIRQNGIVVRDFIPVLDEDGVACMYERVSEKYYYNKGKGTFKGVK